MGRAASARKWRSPLFHSPEVVWIGHELIFQSITVEIESGVIALAILRAITGRILNAAMPCPLQRKQDLPVEAIHILAIRRVKRDVVVVPEGSAAVFPISKISPNLADADFMRRFKVPSFPIFVSVFLPVAGIRQVIPEIPKHRTVEGRGALNAGNVDDHVV